MSRIDVVYTLAKAGYSKEEIANLMVGDTAQATAAAPAAAAPAAAAPAAAAPAAAAQAATAAAPAAAQAATAPAAVSSDEIGALRNRLKVLESVLSVSNTENAESLASIVYPRGE